jgi:hypothetical protein
MADSRGEAQICRGNRDQDERGVHTGEGDVSPLEREGRTDH